MPAEPEPETRPSRSSKLAWAGAALLCAVTLVALWITAQGIKERKVAARGGGVPAEIRDHPGGLLEIARGGTERLDHFVLEHPREGEGLVVRDAKGTLHVRFTRLRPGAVRRWQELELRFIRADRDVLAVQAEMRPGSASYGSGVYASPRVGLRIELTGNRAVTVLRREPGRLQLEATGTGEPLQVDLHENEEERASSIVLRWTSQGLEIVDELE